MRRSGRRGSAGPAARAARKGQTMPHIETVIIGGGQAGLAMSRSLAEHGIEHIILERGQVGERWRSERWDSLRLLTPRWLSRLSGWEDDASDPDGFMDRHEVIEYLERFAESCRAPVHAGVTVNSVREHDVGYCVRTNRGTWTARNVVIATGESQLPLVPAFSRDLSTSVHQVVPTEYRNPEELPDGGVLVVGASATGIQLADEIHASGRDVTLAVGRHTRLPRSYRGRDTLAWFHTMGVLDERARAVRNLEASRNQPSMQLTGSSDRRTLDLHVLQESGVRLVGRLRGAQDTCAWFEDDLVETIAAAEFKLARLRMRIDRYIRDRGLTSQVGASQPFEPVPLPASPTTLDLRRSGIRTVFWATGFRRSYPWLHVPVLDGRGEVVHTEGITPAPGLYVLGLNFLRRRSSSFLVGVGSDAAELALHMKAIRHRRRATARPAVA